MINSLYVNDYNALEKKILMVLIETWILFIALSVVTGPLASISPSLDRLPVEPDLPGIYWKNTKLNSTHSGNKS